MVTSDTVIGIAISGKGEIVSNGPKKVGLGATDSSGGLRGAVTIVVMAASGMPTLE